MTHKTIARVFAVVGVITLFLYLAAGYAVAMILAR